MNWILEAAATPRHTKSTERLHLAYKRVEPPQLQRDSWAVCPLFNIDLDRLSYSKLQSDGWAMFDYACQQTKAFHMGINPLSSTMLDECVLCIYQKRPIHMRTALQLMPGLRQYEVTFKIHINDDCKIGRSCALGFSLTYACATDDNTKRPTSGHQRNWPWFRARRDELMRVESIYRIDAVYLTTPDSVSVVHVLI